MLRQAGERFQQTIPVELRADASDRPHAGNIETLRAGKAALGLDGRPVANRASSVGSLRNANESGDI